ncbi:MAG: hypothetical protein IRD3MM_01520 [Candidatus Midichloria mitochondrii]
MAKNCLKSISTQWWIINYKSYRNFIAHYPEPGTVGCYLSHLKAWEEELDLKFTGVEAKNSLPNLLGFLHKGQHVIIHRATYEIKSAIMRFVHSFI